MTLQELLAGLREGESVTFSRDGWNLRVRAVKDRRRVGEPGKVWTADHFVSGLELERVNFDLLEMATEAALRKVRNP